VSHLPGFPGPTDPDVGGGFPPPPAPDPFPGGRGPGPIVIRPMEEPVFGEGPFDTILHAFLCAIGQQPLFGPPCDQGIFQGETFPRPPAPPVVVPPPVVVAPPEGTAPAVVVAPSMPSSPVFRSDTVIGSPVLTGPTEIQLPEPRQTEGGGRNAFPHVSRGFRRK